MGDRYTIAGYGAGAVAAFQPPSPPRMPPLLLHQLLAVASLLTTTASGSVILGSAGNVCPSSYTKLTTLPNFYHIWGQTFFDSTFGNWRYEFLKLVGESWPKFKHVLKNVPAPRTLKFQAFDV